MIRFPRILVVGEHDTTSIRNRSFREEIDLGEASNTTLEIK